MNQPIGFIGLGLLGSAMATRLLSADQSDVGFDGIIGYDLVAEKTNTLIRQHASDRIQTAVSPALVAQHCDIIHLCVTTSDAVRDVITGNNGITSANSLPGKVVVDHSTTDVKLTRQLATELSALGATLIDAPVSGGPSAALSGSLSIMAGGEAQVIENIRSHVELLGRFTHMGSSGAGQATKLVNQALVLPAYCMMAEALRLAQAYDVDPAKVPHALETGHAGSNLLPILFERMITEDFTPTGFARQVLKDLEMLHAASKDQTVAMPMTDQALTLFRLLVAQGKGELDGSAIVSLWPKPKH